MRSEEEVKRGGKSEKWKKKVRSEK